MPTRKAGKKFSVSQMKEYKILGFFIKLLLFAIPLYIILIFDLRWEALQTFVADIVYAILSSLGIAAERIGNFLIIPVLNGTWGAFITWDCTGWKSLLALFALVMATDFSLKKKLRGLAILLPLLFVVNIARIVFMFLFVHAYDLAYFDFVHAVIWSWGLIIAIFVLWIAWIRLILRGPRKRRRKTR